MIFLVDILISAIIYKIFLKIFKVSITLKELFIVNLISNISIIAGRLLDLICDNFTSTPITSIGRVIYKLGIDLNIAMLAAKIDIFFVIDIILVSIGIAAVLKMQLKKVLPIVIVSNIVIFIGSSIISLIFI